MSHGASLLRGLAGLGGCGLVAVLLVCRVDSYESIDRTTGLPKLKCGAANLSPYKRREGKTGSVVAVVLHRKCDCV